MATPDLDQTLSLQAKMDDSISPTLKKIEKGLKTTSDALRELEASIGQAANKIGGASESMAEKSSRATDRLQESVRKTGQSFQELGSTAQQSAEQVGSALRDTLFTKGGSQRLQELDKELGDLKETFLGMASSNRGTSIRAKKMQAVGKDTLNKRVIPAFRELHATLDAYPDTLKEISGLEKQRMGGLSGALDGVSKRVSGFGDRIKALGFGVSDFVAALTTGVTGARGMKLRQTQISAGRVGGVGAFVDTAEAIPDIQMATQAMEDVWGDAYTTLLDISKVSRSTFPFMLTKMTELHKATGLSTGYFAELAVKIKEISNVDGGAWIDLSEKISTFATQSRASIEDLASILGDAANKMIRFGRESRSAYANAALAQGAAGANIGIGAQAGGDLMEGLMNDTDFLAKMQGLVGGGRNLQAMVSDPNRHLEAMASVYGGLGAHIQNADLDMSNAVHRQSVERMFGGPGISADKAAVVSEFMKENNLRTEGQFTEFILHMEQNMDKQSDEYKKLVSAIRGTAPEQMERMTAIIDAPIADVGNQTIAALEAGMEPAIALTASVVSSLRRMDKESEHFWSRGVAFFSVGMNAMNAMSKLLSVIPGLGGLAKALSTPLATIVGAGAIAHAVGSSVDDKNAAMLGKEGPVSTTQFDAMAPELSNVDSESYIPYTVREMKRDEIQAKEARAAQQNMIRENMKQTREMMVGDAPDPGKLMITAAKPLPPDWNDVYPRVIDQYLDEGGAKWEAAQDEYAKKMVTWEASHISRPSDVSTAEIQERWALDRKQWAESGSMESIKAIQLRSREQLFAEREQEQIYFGQTGKRWNDEMRALYSGDAPGTAFAKDTQARPKDWTMGDEFQSRFGGMETSADPAQQELYKREFAKIKDPEALFSGKGATTAGINVPVYDDGVLNTGGPRDTGEDQLRTQERIAKGTETTNDKLDRLITLGEAARDKHGNIIPPKATDATTLRQNSENAGRSQ